MVVGAGEGETVRNPVGGIVTFKVRGEESGGRMTVFESVIAPGDGPPLHVHAQEDEVLYVLDGEFRFQMGEQLTTVSSGGMMFVPRGVAHCFQNAGDADGRLLITFAPSGMERFFALTDGDREAVAAAGREVGMEIVGLPLSQI